MNWSGADAIRQADARQRSFRFGSERALHGGDDQMPSRVQVLCPDCGPVKVGSEILLLHYCLDTDRHTVSFRCSSCARSGVMSVAGEKLILLVRAGVPEREWSLPAELSDPVRHDDGFHPLDTLSLVACLEQLDANDGEVA